MHVFESRKTTFKTMICMMFVLLAAGLALSTDAFGALVNLDPDQYSEGARIPDDGAYMRVWSASLSNLLASDGHFTDMRARNNFMDVNHDTHAVSAWSDITASTGSMVYGYTPNYRSCIYDGFSMHVLFGSYAPAQNRFNFQPTNFVSIDVLWSSYWMCADYVDFQLFSSDNTRLATYRYTKNPGSFSRMAVFFPGIARVAIVPSNPYSNRDHYGLDALRFVNTATGSNFALSGGSIKAPNNGMTLGNDDRLTGSGTVEGDLTNAGGTVSPGNSPGTITIDGDFTQEAQGTTILELGDGENDKIIVSDQADLDGTLEIDLLEGFDFEEGDVFELMSYASRLGAFDDVLGLEFDGGFFDLNYGDTSLTLTAHAVPLPSALWLLGCGLFSLVGMRKRLNR